MIKKENLYSHCKYPVAEPCSSGDEYRIEYVKAYDEQGNPYLKEVGKTNIQKEIDNACPPLVAEYFQRYLYGDKNALIINDPATAVYADVSEIPTLGEMVANKNKIANALNTVKLMTEQQQMTESVEKGETVTDVNT